MALSSQVTKTVYIPDGTQNRYAVVFPLFSPHDVECFYVDAAGHAAPIADFTVEGFGSEGGVYVRFAAAPAAGGSLVIRRATRQVQESAYPEGGKFPSAVVENDFDRVVGMIQEINEAVDRSLKVNVSEEAPPESAEELYIRVNQVAADAEAAKDAAKADAASADQSAADAAQSRDGAAQSATDAEGSAELARQWAENPEDAPVAPDHFSAFHWAQKADEKGAAQAEKARQWAESPENEPVRGQGQDAEFSALHWAMKALENASSGVSLSDSLDGTRTAVDGVGASEWALARVNEKADGAQGTAAEAEAKADEALALAFAGDIRMLPFRTGALPFGWYFANGNRYALSSPQGAVLYALPADYKTDWGITVSADTINVPNMFYSDGRGYFLRAVNGSSRQVGNAQIDQMRPITGDLSVQSVYNANSWPTGAFSRKTATRTIRIGYSDGREYYELFMNSGLLGSNYNGGETQPLNIGMTPAVFLGV